MRVRAAASEGQVNGGSWWARSQPCSGGQGRTIGEVIMQIMRVKMQIRVFMSAHAYRQHEMCVWFFFMCLMKFSLNNEEASCSLSSSDIWVHLAGSGV